MVGGTRTRVKCMLVMGLVWWTIVASASDATVYNKVRFKNSLKFNKTVMIDCSQKKAVKQYVPPNTVFRFNVDDNFWGTTKIFCVLKQGPNYEHQQGFDAYTTNFWRTPGVVYSWDVREDGIYFTRDTKKPWSEKDWKFKFGWRT